MNPNLNPAAHASVVDHLTDIVCAIDDIAIDCRWDLNKSNLPDEVRTALFKHLNTIHDAQMALCHLLISDRDGNERGYFVLGDTPNDCPVCSQDTTLPVGCTICDPASPDACDPHGIVRPSTQGFVM